MKTYYKIYMMLVLAVAFLSAAYSQKSSPEHDDMYYIPSEKKTAPVTEKKETATPSVQTYEPDDYEKYINSLENQRSARVQQEYPEDSVTYSDDPNYMGGEYYEKDGNTYITNNYYTDDYYYATQIRRFYDPYMTAGYYSSWYMDPYWYQPGWSFGMSFGFPYMSFGFSYGYPYYGYGYPYYGYGYGYPYYGYGYYPYYYDSYWYGYNHGFYNGYYYGSGGDMYYPDHRPVYYGPRRSIESNRMASAGSVTGINGRRISSASATARTASGTSSAYGRRTLSTDDAINRTTQNTGTTKSTAGSTTVRRPYGTATGTGTNASSSSSNARRISDYSGTPAQDRPVYTRPSTSSSQSRPSYSGTSEGSGTRSTSGGTTYSRPSSSSGSTYSRPSSSSGSSYSRPSSSSGSSYSRPSSSSGSSYSRPSSSSGSYSSGSRSSGGSSSGSRSSGPSSSGSRR